MANDYEEEGGGGSGFMVGLLTGTVLGAGLGMLFAPKSGSELRGQISESASNVSRVASEQYQKVASKATDLAEKGREIGRDVAGRARDAVNRGTEEAKRYANEPQTSSGSSMNPTTGPGSSPYSPGPTRG